MYSIDESNYLRGLLLLAAVDGEVLPSEKKFIIEVGSSLGFEEEFCSEAIENIYYNKNVDRSIPRFQNKLLAKRFIEDGYKLASIDSHMSFEELMWLKKAETINSNQYSETLKVA
ncbi:MAG: hypothetical protein Q8933_15135 [Bacteroidota bacterium]|jgi:hypothetical protein|nr:hypothetical protein [Bacteroidota bacterium]MDP4193225.1 hypothetical protein [Bacteroidota bacterium]MDP4196164.1 hypothetical protein [Bacteroidota bacterium]